MAQDPPLPGALPAPFLGLSVAEWVGVAAILLVVLSLGVVVLGPRLLRRRRPRAAQQAYNADAYRRKVVLDEMGLPSVNNVLIPGRDGKAVRLEHVVRLPASVLIVFSGPADAMGKVSASPRAGLWRYVGADGKIATFTNPVIQLKPLVQALRARYPLVRIRLLTVFPDSAQFTSGIPDTACLTSDFKTTLRTLAHADGDPSESLATAWEPLSQALTHRHKIGSPAGADKMGAGKMGAGKAGTGKRGARG